jgi:hypothetical protein
LLTDPLLTEAVLESTVSSSSPTIGNNLQEKPEFRNGERRDFGLAAKTPRSRLKIGARGFPSADSPWPRQAEEQRTIRAVADRFADTRRQRSP